MCQQMIVKDGYGRKWLYLILRAEENHKKFVRIICPWAEDQTPLQCRIGVVIITL